MQLTINTLSEYLKAIEKYNLFDCISRGESTKHEEIIASAFRPYKDPLTKNKYYSASHVEEFYNYIGNELTPIQQNNFLAVAQHHGVPTNIVDFSFSPLVSLFFACYDESKDKKITKKENIGQVYFIENKKLVNANPLIGRDFSQQLLLNLFKFESDYLKFAELIGKQRILKGTAYYDAINHLVNLIFLVYPHSCIVEPLSYAIHGYDEQTMLYHQTNEPNKALKIYTEAEKDMFYMYVATNVIKIITNTYYGESFVEQIDKLDLEKAKALLKNSSIIKPIDDDIWAFLFILKYVLKIIAHKIHRFELPFYLTYTPPEMINRVMNQRSIFICQLSFAEYFTNAKIEEIGAILSKIDGKDYEPNILEVNDLTLQKIKPDVVVVIKDKAKILRELDYLGINLKSIYGDYDSIAKYIKNKL